MTLEVYNKREYGYSKKDDTVTPVLSLYIHGITDSEHEINLKDLAEALKPFLKEDNNDST